MNRPFASPSPRRRRMMALLLTSALTLGAVSGGAASAAKTPTAGTQHCLARVIGRRASGEFQLSTPVCYATYTAVLEHVGQPVADKGVTTMSGGTFIIGTHYDGLNLTGSSFSVEGVDCYGGYINLTGWWANRVSSTWNGCPLIHHFYLQDLGGTWETTTPGDRNLSALDNLSESIQYAGW